MIKGLILLAKALIIFAVVVILFCIVVSFFQPHIAEYNDWNEGVCGECGLGWRYAGQYNKADSNHQYIYTCPSEHAILLPQIMTK